MPDLICLSFAPRRIHKGAGGQGNSGGKRVSTLMNGFRGQIAISLRSEAKHPKGGPQAKGNLRSDPENARFRLH